jgi:hypothetical protein
MVSGIGPANILQKHGIKIIADRPGVGQNMWDHVFFGPSYPVAVKTFTGMTQSKVELVTQILYWALWHKGFLTNPSTDLLAFEKLPAPHRSTFSAKMERDLSWFPADWPEVEVRYILINFDFSERGQLLTFVVSSCRCFCRQLFESLWAATRQGSVWKHCCHARCTHLTRECHHTIGKYD